MTGGYSGRRRWVVPVLVVVGLAVAAWLIATGGSDDTRPAPAGGGPTATTTSSIPTPVTGTLDLSDTSQAKVAALAGFTFPTSATDFLTAQVGDGTQLDVTFTFEPGDEASFVAGSGLPVPAIGTRVVTHSSPLWKLNPEGSIRGAADVKGRVRRQVELVAEGGRTRVRAVVTPSS